jgi:hypothetical protein
LEEFMWNDEKQRKFSFFRKNFFWNKKIWESTLHVPLFLNILLIFS